MESNQLDCIIMASQYRETVLEMLTLSHLQSRMWFFYFFMAHNVLLCFVFSFVACESRPVACCFNVTARQSVKDALPVVFSIFEI